jgi:ribose/xylose/arabinose/galactoside ABC-type transport system permease subunit
MTDRVEIGVSGRPARSRRAKGFSWRTVVNRYGTLIALAALLLFNIAVTPNFLHQQTLYVNLTQVATIAIVAIGMTLVIATGGIDLSVGAMMALAGALAPLIFLSEFGRAHPELGLAAAIVLPVMAAALGGLFNGVLVSFVGIQPIVATLILFISGRGIAQVLTNGNLQTFSNPGFGFLGTGRVLGVPTQALIAIALGFAAAWLVSRTVYGRYLLAIGGNERAARLSGVPVRRVTIITYMLCAALAGVAGLVVSAINSASDANQTGQLMELDAIAAAVVGGAVLSGGRAPVLGALLGAAIIQLVRYTLLANGVPDAVALIAKAAIIVGAVYIQQGRKE